MGGQTSTQPVVKDRFSIPITKKEPISHQRQQKNNRNNVFKVSGNMALGANDGQANDITDIKNSLRLLKSKQPQKHSNGLYESSNNYNGSYASKASQRQKNNSKNYSIDQYQKYNYAQPKTTRNPPNSYKDVYQLAQQNYPSNDYANKKRSMTRQQHQPYNPKPSQKQPQRAQKQYYYEQPQYKPRNQPKAVNSYQQKNIKQLNRQNRVQIQEYDPSEFIQCSEGCGRKFNPQSISRHQAICRKVFQQKRKEFNAQDQRIVVNQQKRFMKKGDQVERKILQKKANQKIPKWKAESLQLRAGIKQVKNEDYSPSKEQQRILNQVRSSGLVKCQFCCRSFNQQASIKHIPFCESQQRKNIVRRR